MKAGYLKGLHMGAAFSVVASTALLVIPVQTTGASPPSSSPRQELVSVQVLQEINEQQLISMAKEAVVTKLIGGTEFRFDRLSANLSSGGRSVVCGSVSYRMPVYMPSRTEKFVMFWPEKKTTLESGYPRFGARWRVYCQ